MDALSLSRSLSTKEVKPNEVGAYWRDFICATYVRLQCEEYDKNDFFGEIEFFPLSTMMISQVHSTKQRVIRTKSNIDTSADEVFLFNIQLTGQSQVYQDNRCAHLKPGDWTFTDASRPYQLRFNNEFKQMVLKIPKDVFDISEVYLNNVTALTVKGNVGMGKLTSLFLQSLLTLGATKGDEHLTSSVFSLTKNIVQEGLSHCLMRTDLSFSNNVMLYKLKAYIADNFCDPTLTVKQIASVFQCSERYLHHSFSNETHTIGKYIREKRLDRSKEIIESNFSKQYTLSEIAFKCGFGSLSSFSKEFKRQYGMPPRDYQEMFRSMR